MLPSILGILFHECLFQWHVMKSCQLIQLILEQDKVSRQEVTRSLNSTLFFSLSLVTRAHLVPRSHDGKAELNCVWMKLNPGRQVFDGASNWYPLTVDVRQDGWLASTKLSVSPSYIASFHNRYDLPPTTDMYHWKFRREVRTKCHWLEYTGQ